MADHAKRTTRLVSFRRHCGRPRFVSQAGLPRCVDALLSVKDRILAGCL
jgi:hypothetical protein